MKMKIIKPMSTYFRVGEIVEMRITNERGDFIISADDRKQSFGFAYRSHLTPLIPEGVKVNRKHVSKRRQIS
jgi:hypothetical protein